MFALLSLGLHDLRGEPDEEFFDFHENGTVVGDSIRADLRYHIFGMTMSEGQHFYWKTSETTQEEAVALVRVPSKHDPRMKGVWLVFRPSKKTHSFQSDVRSSVSSQAFPGLK